MNDLINIYDLKIGDCFVIRAYEYNLDTCSQGLQRVPTRFTDLDNLVCICILNEHRDVFYVVKSHLDTMSFKVLQNYKIFVELL